LLGTFNLRNGVDLTAKAALAQEKRRRAGKWSEIKAGKLEKGKVGKAASAARQSSNTKEN